MECPNGSDAISASGAENNHNYRHFCAAVGVGFFGVFLAPVPNNSVRAIEQKLFAGRAGEGIVVVGNSVVDHRSACDTDRQTIPEMIAAKTGHSVGDLSYGGQRIDESLVYASQALRRDGAGPVVFFVSVFAFNNRLPFDLQTQLFFRLVAGPLHATSLFDRVLAGAFVEPPMTIELQPYSYKGRSYPDYNRIKEVFFSRERQGCPETLGKDKAFIEATYWNNYLRSTWHTAHVSDLATLTRRSIESSHRLLVVLLPIDRGDIAFLSAELATSVQRRSDEIVVALRGAGVPLLDLSSTQPPNSFADRWCACGHLLEEGRRYVALRVAGALASTTGHE